MNRALAWRLNVYRYSELEGSLLLARMVRLCKDPFLVEALTRHAADEARHSALWVDTIRRLNLPLIRIFRSYQSLYFEQGRLPSRIEEVLAITHVFEHRVDKMFSRELEHYDHPPALRETFQIMLDDEQQHLSWIAGWLSEQADGKVLIDRYTALDSRVFNSVEPFLEKLWEYPNIGEE